MDQRTLIEDLDFRQNETLERLAELNARVEALLNECLAARDEALKAAEIDPPHSAALRKVTPGGPNAPISQLPSVSANQAAR